MMLQSLLILFDLNPKGKVMRKLVLFFLVLVLFACGSDPEPVSLDGGWSSESDDPSEMTATILDNVMEIYFVDDGVHMLYWVGTAPDTVLPGDAFVSEGDVEALAVSLMGSGEETKTFRFEDNSLKFELGMLGVEWEIAMLKEG
jgi:fermentation-respiration switch protein FrsA (DUF1100 family)